MSKCQSGILFPVVVSPVTDGILLVAGAETVSTLPICPCNIPLASQAVGMLAFLLEIGWDDSVSEAFSIESDLFVVVDTQGSVAPSPTLTPISRNR